MNFDKQHWSWQDLQKLTMPLAVFCMVILTVVVCVLLSTRYFYSQKAQLQTQQNLLNAVRQREQLQALEQATLIQYLPKYQTLTAQGFVGEPKPNQWLGMLREIQQHQHLFTIEYRIHPPEDDTVALAGLVPLTLHRTAMQLDFDMLHEGDLLQLTNALHEKSAATLMLQACEITRLNEDATLSDTLVANLHGQCILDGLNAQ